MDNFILVALTIGNRNKDAPAVQEVLTNFGCSIKVRLGLHDLPADTCTPYNLIFI